MGSRFVVPETDVLTLPLQEGQTEADWLLVRRRLNEGERRAMFARMYLSSNGDTHLDPQAVGISTVLAYLLDWSFTDPHGNRVAIAEKSPADVASVLDSLDPDAFKEVSVAIYAHEERWLAAKKKTLAGGNGSPAISDSPSTADGATSGSLNLTPTSTTSSSSTC
jgi:hypothetical protein